MRIGILEDEDSQIALYQLWLSTLQHQVIVFPSLATFTESVLDSRVDLLIIDKQLPDGSGETALAWVRERMGWQVPVIFVTADPSEASIVAALRLGADDYVVKPARYFELTARIAALVRRSRAAAVEKLLLGAYEIDLLNREIRLSGRVVELTQREFDLAVYLFQHPGRLMSRMHLLETIWGLNAEVDTRTVDTHVSRLRRKLHIGPPNGWEIISVYGYGYRIENMAANVGAGPLETANAVPGQQ